MFSTFATIFSISNKSVSIPPPPTPYLYYTFNSDTVSGTTVSSVNSTSSQTLTLSNALASSTLNPKEGNKCFYGGNRNYYASSQSLSIPVSNSNGLSVCFWTRFNASTTSNNGVQFSLGIGTSYKLHILTGNTTLEVSLLSSGSNNQCSHTFTTGSWNHIAFTWIGTTLKIYVNGVQKSLTTNASIVAQCPTNDTWTSMFVNRRTDGVTGICYNDFDCLRLYNQVLTQSDITQIYNAGN